MSRRTMAERNIRTLNKVGGGTISFTIPIELVRELAWREGQKVVVKKQGSSLGIADWKK